MFKQLLSNILPNIFPLFWRCRRPLSEVIYQKDANFILQHYVIKMIVNCICFYCITANHTAVSSGWAREASRWGCAGCQGPVIPDEAMPGKMIVVCSQVSATLHVVQHGCYTFTNYITVVSEILKCFCYKDVHNL